MKNIFLLLFIIFGHQSLHSQWQWVNPMPQGNSIYTFELHAGKLISVGSCATIQMSTSHGATWEVYNTAADIRASLTAVFCFDQSTYYAGVEGNGVSIIKSTNSGVTWTALASNLSQFGISTRGIHFIDQNNGYLLSKNTIFKTSDGGENWSAPMPVNLQEATDLYFFNKDTGLVAGGDILFTGNALMRTTNGGQNWQSLISNVNGQIYNIQFINNDTGYAFHENYTFITKDRGVTWDTLGDPNNTQGGYGCFLNYSTGYRLYGGDVFYTTNSGTNWSLRSDLNLYGIMKIDFSDQNTGYILADNNVMLRTTNAGQNWQNITTATGNGTATAKLLSSCFLDQNTGFIAGWVGTLLKTTNGGNTWTNVNNLSVNQSRHLVGIDFINNSTGYCIRSSSWLGDLVKTTDGGSNWFVADSIALPSGSLQSIKFVNETLGFTVDGDGNIYRSSNSGNDWSLHQNLGNMDLGNLFFSDNNTGYMTGYIHPNQAKVFKTTNSGQNWNLISDIGGQNLSSIFATGNNTLYASGKGLLKSTNGGVNWIQKLTGPNATTSFYNVYFSSDSVGYLSGFGTMFKSTDFGENWHQLYCPTNFSLNEIHFFNDNTGMFMGDNAIVLKTTNGGGNFISGVNQISIEIPEGYSLNQNYPNPFNPSTNISFDIPKRSFVELKVYDITGKLISTLVNENLSPGSYNFNWNAANLSSGVYFYTLKSSEYVSTKKMLLIK